MLCINPATEALLDSPPDHAPHEVEALLQQSKLAFESWRHVSLEDRAGRMRQLAALLRRDRPALSQLMTLEMGKPVTAAGQEIDKCAAACEFFADHAAAMLAPELIESDAARSYVRFDPLGPVLAIMPWNFPFWQVFRFAAPSLMAGNVGILKHASIVPGCATAIENLFNEAGFPCGALVQVRVAGKNVAELIRHRVIQAVTLTGSTQAGKSVAAEAGAVLKKVVLELGGSDPFIVLGDVDAAAVAAKAAVARCINSGQSCIAAKRFIVVESIADQFEEAMIAAMRKLVVGDPLDPQTEVGPLARLDLLEELDSQVRRSVDAGAKLRCGGQRLERAGYFYPPTVLTGVRPGMAAFDEETFGPVAAIIRCGDEDEAVKLANQSIYGLGASLWTRDIEKANVLAAHIESGCVFINGIVKSDARLPFGGVKESGFGRELSMIGIREFVNVKTVWVGG